MNDYTAQPPYIDEQLIFALLAEQFPDWSARSLAPVASSGTDNYLARLGDDLCIRLPKVAWAASCATKEYDCVPRFAGLPLRTPTPRALGQPGCGYPWNWTVCDWIEGKALGAARFDDQMDAASQLSGFLHALRNVDPSGGPVSGPANHFRGAHLSVRDNAMRKAIAELAPLMDTRKISRLWQTWLDAPIHEWQPTWLHGDLHGGNILIKDSALIAVIDFGLAGVGDAACDLMAGWSLFDTEAREVFRKSMHVSEADWLRGAAWELSVACIGLAFYKDANAELSARAKRTIEQLMADFA